MESESLFQKNIRFFSDRVERFPNKNYEALHYNSGESQVMRFVVLSKVADLKNCTVLDFGCGLGDFGYYLDKLSFEVEYTGIDIIPKMIERGRISYPKLNLIAKTENELKSYSKKFDYCFASGVFNLSTGKDQDSIEYMEYYLSWMFERCNIAMAFNFSTENHGDSNFKKYDIKSVMKIVGHFSKNVVLKEGYLKGDASIFVYKD